MEFIRTRRALPLCPSTGGAGNVRPWFLWDYDLSEAQVREILAHASFEDRKWLLARMLERLGPNEIVGYIPLQEIEKALPHLRLGEKLKRHWKEAVELWKKPASKS